MAGTAVILPSRMKAWVRRVGEKTVSVIPHPPKYDAAVPWLASVMS